MVKKGKNSKDLIANEIFNMNYRYEDRENNNIKNKFELSMIDCVKKRFDKVKKEDSIAELNFVFEEFEIIKELMKNDLGHKKTNKESENSNQNINNKTFDESNNDELAETLNEGIKNSGNEHKNLNFIDNKNKKKNAINWKRIIFAYIEEIKQFLSQIKTSDILFVLNFIEKFYLELYSNFKISKENLNDSDLLENKEDYYISEYVKTATSSLGNWIENIINNELDIFYTRESSPILDEDDKYISNNFINFLQLIKQQLEPISFNKKMFLIITKEIVKFASLFSKEIIKAMEKDLIPSCKQKSVPGYEEYVIMMGNSGLKVTQYVSSLPQAQLSEVKDLGNVFISITKKSNFFLSCFVLNTCKPVTDKIFTEEWYNEEITKVVTVTIDDFLIDYKHTMSDFSFITFIYELSSELTKLYLKQLIRNRAKIYEDCGYRLQKDYERFFDLFIKYGEKEEVKSNLEAFEKIVPLLGRCNEEMFIIELKSLLIVYPDIKREYIKCIVNKKNELSDNEKKSLLVKVKECFGEIKNVRKTLFSNLLF
ncbi:SNARE-binding exocyst subunit S6 [Gurleya vavrai]